MSDVARRPRAVVWWPAVALAGVLVGCATGLTSLTSEQAKGLDEAQRIANQVTKGYGVPGVRVYPISLGPGTGGTWAYQNDWIFVRPELLTGPRLLVLISHELGHVTLGHRPLYVPNVQRTAVAVERERAANRRGVEILVKYLGLTEQQALDHYATYFIEANRVRHGQDVLLPFGHLHPCVELNELWEGFGKTAPPCEITTAK
jgi:hypothetical protein